MTMNFTVTDKNLNININGFSANFSLVHGAEQAKGILSAVFELELKTEIELDMFTEVLTWAPNICDTDDIVSIYKLNQELYQMTRLSVLDLPDMPWDCIQEALELYRHSDEISDRDFQEWIDYNYGYTPLIRY